MEKKRTSPRVLADCECAGEPTDEADRGRHPGFARHEGLAGGPGSLSLSFDAKGDRLVFCERCATLTRRLTLDPLAEPRAELLTGSCIWMDERCRDWCGECTDNVKELFHLRYQITVGDAVPPEAIAYFLELAKRFPNWPLFRP